MPEVNQESGQPDQPDEPNHITRNRRGPKLGERKGPKLRFVEPFSEMVVPAPTNDASIDDSIGEDYELDDGTESVRQAPELPSADDVLAYRKKVAKLRSALKKKSAEMSDALSPELADATSGVSPRVVAANVKAFASLFDEGQKLLSLTVPRHFKDGGVANAPFDLLEANVTRKEAVFQSAKIVERDAPQLLTHDPVQLRDTFYSAVMFHAGPSPEVLLAAPELMAEVLELTRWEFIRDVTGATRGLMAPEAQSSGGEKSASKPDEKPKAAEKPERKRKKLNYGRPGDEAAADTDEKPSKDEDQDAEEAPLSATALGELGRADFEQELFKSELASFRTFRERIRSSKEKQHDMYGSLLPTFAAVMKQQSDPLSYIDNVTQRVSFSLMSWAKHALLYELESKEKASFALDDLEKSYEQAHKLHGLYAGIEPDMKAISLLLRLADYEEHVDSSAHQLLKKLAPTVEEVSYQSPSSTMQQNVAASSRERIRRDHFVRLVKRILVTHSNDPAMRAAGTDEERSRIAEEIAEEEMKDWKPPILDPLDGM